MSQKTKKLLSLFWLLVSLAASMGAMHFYTDFEIHRLDWWKWLGQSILSNGFPKPYLWFFLMIPGLFFFGVLVAPLFKMSRKTYGDARKATRREIKKMGLCDNKGLVLGQERKALGRRGRLYMSKKTLHGIIVAGTGSGKTESLVIPQLLYYPGAAVVIDPKGELWDMTAGHRSKYSDCHRVELTADITSRYNPISLKHMPDSSDKIELKLSKVAGVLGVNGEHYFDKAAFLAGQALLLLEVFDAKTEGREALMSNVAFFAGDLSPEDKKQKDALGAKLRRSAQRAEERGYPRNCWASLYELADTAKDERSGVMNTLKVNLQGFRAASIDKNTSGCDFTARGLVNGKRPGTIYLVVKPDDRELVTPVISAIISDITYELLSRTKAEAEKEHSMLLMLEEFSSLKKMKAIEEVLDRGRGMKTHTTMVVQSFGQIMEIYGKETFKVFMDNCEWMFVFSQGNTDIQKQLSDAVGKKTDIRQSKTDQSHGGGSVSESEEGLHLIPPQEWGRIPQGQIRILVKHHYTRPVFAFSAWYKKDANCRKWVKKHPPAVVPEHLRQDTNQQTNKPTKRQENAAVGF